MGGGRSGIWLLLVHGHLTGVGKSNVAPTDMLTLSDFFSPLPATA